MTVFNLMNSTIKLFSLLLVVLALSLMACKGEDGLMGAVGPVGPQGVAGVDGTNGSDGVAGTDGRDGIDGQDGKDGVDGVDGQDGKVNVIFSPWEEVTWTIYSPTLGAYDLDGSLITADHLNKAAILGFMRFSGNYIFPLPYPWSPNVFFTYAVNEGIFVIDYIAEEPFTVPVDVEARYVIIPPEGRHNATGNPKQAILEELQAANVDIKDFDQVAKYFDALK